MLFSRIAIGWGNIDEGLTFLQAENDGVEIVDDGFRFAVFDDHYVFATAWIRQAQLPFMAWVLLVTDNFQFPTMF